LTKDKLTSGGEIDIMPLAIFQENAMSETIPEPAIYRQLNISLLPNSTDPGVYFILEPEGRRIAADDLATLPFEDDNFSDIYVCHIVQRLRRAEALNLLRECWRVLQPGGNIYLLAPNIEYYFEQYRKGDKVFALAGLWGEQKSPEQLHHWGYTRQSLCDLLTEAGFVQAVDRTAAVESLEKNEQHLEASARKLAPRTDGQVVGSADQGRQMVASEAEVRSDHVERYHFACQFVKEGAVVLDIACGVGYGSSLLAYETPCSRVIGVDIDEEAVYFAKKHFSHKKVTFLQGDCLDESLSLEPADCIISFETLEHIPRDIEFIGRLRQLLKPEGVLIISSPNQEVFPFSEGAVPYHVRHYTSQELRDLLIRSGFDIVAEVSQDTYQIHPGFGRRFNIAVCQREDRVAKEQFSVSNISCFNPKNYDSRDRSLGLILSTCHALFSQKRNLEQERERLNQERERLSQERDKARQQRSLLSQQLEQISKELEAHAKALQQLRSNPLFRLLRIFKRG